MLYPIFYSSFSRIASLCKAQILCMKIYFHALFSKNSYVVLLEFFNTLICKRMLCHLFDYTVRNCCNVCTCKCAVCYMDRVTNACCNYLCLNLRIVCENICNALAARSAWFAEKISVTLHLIPSRERTFVALRPSTVIGILTIMFL